METKQVKRATITKNGKRMGRPLGSKTRKKVVPSTPKVNHVEVIKDFQEKLFASEYANFQMSQELECNAEKIQDLRKQLAEAQIACLDGIAVIRYLEKKVYDLVKAEQK